MRVVGGWWAVRETAEGEGSRTSSAAEAAAAPQDDYTQPVGNLLLVMTPWSGGRFGRRKDGLPAGLSHCRAFYLSPFSFYPFSR